MYQVISNLKRGLLGLPVPNASGPVWPSRRAHLPAVIHSASGSCSTQTILSLCLPFPLPGIAWLLLY